MASRVSIAEPAAQRRVLQRACDRAVQDRGMIVELARAEPRAIVE